MLLSESAPLLMLPLVLPLTLQDSTLEILSSLSYIIGLPFSVNFHQQAYRDFFHFEKIISRFFPPTSNFYYVSLFNLEQILWNCLLSPSAMIHPPFTIDPMTLRFLPHHFAQCISVRFTNCFHTDKAKGHFPIFILQTYQQHFTWLIMWQAFFTWFCLSVSYCLFLPHLFEL